MLPVILTVAICCFILERIIPGWSLPRVKTWPLRVILINLVQLGIVILAGFTWEKWLSSWSLLNLGTLLPPWAGGAIAYFIATFVFYWWHRVRHTNDWLWKHFHQIHHSPQRLEVITSFYKHPLEMTVNSIIGSLLVYTILGLSVSGGAIYTLFTALGEFFYHTNVKTPRWIGLFFQRPEMHRIHHKYNYHRNNYGDIVWWDMLFGTYENPETFTGTCGFDDAKEQSLGRMLAFEDVHLKKPRKTKAQSVASLLIVFLSFASITEPARACTSFRTQNAAGDSLLAKNYDWAIGDGYVVAMPRDVSYHAITSETMTWTAKYASLAFTQFATGLTISGMNERGLAIETLVNATGRLTPYQDEYKESLISLQWVQYQLDTAATVDEVIASLQQVGITQIFIPVHFLACDRTGHCAVIETDWEGHAKVSHQATKSESIVLANRDWSIDNRDVKNSSFLDMGLSLKSSSARRFRKAATTLNARNTMTVSDAFDLLDDTGMLIINRWQIVWNVTEGTAYWRNKDGKSSDARFAQFSIADIPSQCDNGRVLAAKLGSDASVAPQLKAQDRQTVNHSLHQTFEQSMKVIELRSKKDKALMTKINRAVNSQQGERACR